MSENQEFNPEKALNKMLNMYADIQIGKNLESNFADIKKTVDYVNELIAKAMAAGESLCPYYRLKSEILEMVIELADQLLKTGDQ